MRTPAAHPDRLTAEERRELDDDAFGIPSRREFPLVDAAHVRAAESYFRYAPEADKPALAWRRMRQAGGVRHRDPQRNDLALGGTDRKAVTADS